MNWTFLSDESKPRPPAGPVLLAIRLLGGEAEVVGGYYGYESFYSGDSRQQFPLYAHEVIAWAPMPAVPSASPERGPEPS